MMKETYIVNKESEHTKILHKLFENIEKKKIKRILDCGSGKTSVSILLDSFLDAEIEAIVYYNDIRKINSIQENVQSQRLYLIEKDLCKDKVAHHYDLVLAHLLLGESGKFGNSFEKLLESFLEIDSDYFIIVDILEDPALDYNILEHKIEEMGKRIAQKVEIAKLLPQEYENFTAKTYIGYVIQSK